MVHPTECHGKIWAVAQRPMGEPAISHQPHTHRPNAFIEREGDGRVDGHVRLIGSRRLARDVITDLPCDSGDGSGAWESERRRANAQRV